MNEFYRSLDVVGYALAAAVYLILAVLLITSFRGKLRDGLLLGTVCVSTLWAALLSWSAASLELTTLGVFLAEMTHYAAWLLYLSALLSGARAQPRIWFVRYGGMALIVTVVALGLHDEFLTPGSSARMLIVGGLLTSLFGLVVVEQIYRNARPSQRTGLKYLCLSLGGMFAYDLLLYSNAILMGGISELIWDVRGYVAAMLVPLIAVAAQRSPFWSVGIFVSRQIVFYTATLMGAGVYLTAVGFAGYYIHDAGGTSGAAIQLIFFSGAIIGLFVFLFSDRSRARLRVFISKHFFENRYDYREEWLRMIATLTDADDGLPLAKRAIQVLAQIIDAPKGLLWMRVDDTGEYSCNSSWNTALAPTVLPADDVLAGFLKSSGWVIDISEYHRNPAHYGDLQIDATVFGLADPGVIVPLFHHGELLGFIVLAARTSGDRMNYEDHDLLKTAGRQIASYLSQHIATEKLAEVRQFEAFHKLTAYIMHDLKNVIAQQSMLVQNAKKHRDKPAFIDDVITTVDSSVQRMRRVMEQLRQGSIVPRLENVELGKVILQVVSQCSDREPTPRARIGDLQAWIRADRDRLLSALYHAIRNAQDATPVDGEVCVVLEKDHGIHRVRVTDTGRGMDEIFIRERLFKPFDSTKGTQGMGIGAYQIRETVTAQGGELAVSSVPGHGTELVLTFPAVL